VSDGRPSKAVRRVRSLAAVAAVLGLVAALRRSLLARDQASFDARYGRSDGGPHAL
jgi:hypothetical protein